jgi:hypothetical protein
MSKKVTIELEFDSQNVSKEDVYSYLKELIEDDSLDYEVDSIGI